MADDGFWNVMALYGLAAYVAFQFILMSSRYKRCASDEILVVYGRIRGGRASRCIHGGAMMVWPLIQDYKKLSLVPMKIKINLTDARTQSENDIDVPGTFTIGISTDPLLMNNAAERLLHLSTSEIEDLASEIISSQLRFTVASLTIEQINKEPDKFLENIKVNVGYRLHALGLQLINVNYRTVIHKSNQISNQGGKIRIDTGGKVFGPYSPGVKAGGVIWLAGQIAPEAGGIAEQTQASLDKIDALLAAAGVSKNQVTFAQVLLDDINDFSAMNEVYGAWLEDVEIPPARAAFEAAKLPGGAAIEIVVQAHEDA
tara:strand:- start:641 stop:1585 length:945 start_codon:yes stop_codon:yes gene_type:complete